MEDETMGPNTLKRAFSEIHNVGKIITYNFAHLKALDDLIKRHQEAHRMFWIESGEQQCPECERLK